MDRVIIRIEKPDGKVIEQEAPNFLRKIILNEYDNRTVTIHLPRKIYEEVVKLGNEFYGKKCGFVKASALACLEIFEKFKIRPEDLPRKIEQVSELEVKVKAYESEVKSLSEKLRELENKYNTLRIEYDSLRMQVQERLGNVVEKIETRNYVVIIEGSRETIETLKKILENENILISRTDLVEILKTLKNDGKIKKFEIRYK